jgi:hypothetical protein
VPSRARRLLPPGAPADGIGDNEIHAYFTRMMTLVGDKLSREGS